MIQIKLITNTPSVKAFKITPALLKPLLIFFLLLTPKHNPVIPSGKTNIILEMIKEAYHRTLFQIIIIGLSHHVSPFVS